jgi:small subunit ribosomal protein S21
MQILVGRQQKGKGGQAPGGRRGTNTLAEVVVGDHESFESALRRFTKKVQADGILREAKQREHYEKPSAKRKRKAAARLRKSARR